MTNSTIRAAFAAMAGIGALFGGIGAADATLVQTFSVDHANGPVSQQLAFDAATPNTGGNGVLLEVDISFSDLTVGGGDQATLTGGEGGTSTRGGVTADLFISDVSGALLSGSTSIAQSSCTGNFTGCTGTTQTPTQPGFTPGNPVVITDGGALADFIGAPVELTAQISDYSVVAQTCSPGIHTTTPTCGGFDNVTWSPTVTVSYIYAATDVPEPAMLGILGLAGSSLTMLRRRRRPPS